MNLVYLVIGIMAAAAMLAILLPLVRREDKAPREAYDLAVYNDQLTEIERDRARGLLREEEAKAARVEIERRILKVARSESSALRSTDVGRATALVAALLVPVLALGIYGSLGRPGMPDLPIAGRDVPEADPQLPDVATMVARLETKLAKNPDDAQGWLMLGRSRMVLGRPADAAVAYRKALGLVPEAPQALVGLGEALTAEAQGIVTPEARTIFTKLSLVDPADPRASYYLGLAQYQAGNPRAAVDTWTDLLSRHPADAPWRTQVQEIVRQAASEAGMDADAVLASATGTPPAAQAAQAPPPPAGPGAPSSDDMQRMAAMSPEERDSTIRGMVAGLESRLADEGGTADEWARLGRAQGVLGEREKAREAWAKAVELAPQNPQFLKSYAAASLGPNDTKTGFPEVSEEAKELYQRAASMLPDDPEPLWFLGIRALQEGQVAQARSQWEKLLQKLDPAHPDYAAVKAQLDALGS